MNHSYFSRVRVCASLSAFLLLLFAQTGFSASSPQTFTDSDGDVYTVRLAGAGAASVTISDPDTDTRGPISSIALTGTDSTSVLTIAVAKIGDGRVKIGAITGTGAVNIISAPACDFDGAGISLGGATLLRLGDLAAGANIVLPTRPKLRPLAVSARDVGAMQLTVPASTLTFAARSVSGNTKISAPVIAAFNVTSGSCAADITTPGRLVSLSVKGGDFTGHIAARSIGAMSVLKSAAGAGGALRDSTITARVIGSLVVAGDLVNSLVLAGANLGADFALGGSGANADSFGAGTVGSVVVLGGMTNSVAGAGFTPLDGKFGDANDGTIGGTASKLTSFLVRGQIDSLSRIGAGALPQFVFVNRGKFRPARDARFISRKVVIPNAPVVTQLSDTATLPAAAATSFLYTGANVVQTGVAPGVIKADRATVIRGRVLQRDGTVLPGVTIRIFDHPEFGETHSRADGMFDLAVNGGGVLTVKFDASGFCPVQRQVSAGVQDFATLADVMMTGQDAAVTEVQFGAGTALQVHTASMQTDADGPRGSAIVIEPDTTASLMMPDGTTKPMTSLNIRATEFTVGANGPKTMPGTLPPNSAYTYCAELTADEAEASGATGVVFNKPVWFYVDNFLHFGAGNAVPSGFFNRTRGLWEAGPSGRVMKVLSVIAGSATLDVTGDDVADSGAALDTLGVTPAELLVLGARYTAGQSFWRVPIPHFSPWDCNWPYGPPPGAGPPNGGPPTNDDPPDDCDDPPNIYLQNQAAGESLRPAGIPFSLNYRSDRVPGRTAAQRIKIPLSGATLPGPVKRIEQTVSIAGRTFTQSFAPGTNLASSFQWDGLDAYSRPVVGRQTAKVSIGYVYDGAYQAASRFGYNGAGAITGDRTRQEITISKQESKVIGGINVREQGIGGWTLDVHHIYDPVERKLYLGDGSTRSAEAVNSVIETVGGSDQMFTAGFNNDGIPATQARLSRSAFFAVAADGAIYFTDAILQQVFRIGTDGILRVIAGTTNTAGYNGDERSALSALLNAPFGIALAPDGTVFFNDFGNRRTRSITPDGMIHTVAGSGVDGYSGDGGPATAARIGGCVNLSYAAADGSLFISDSNKHAIRRVGTDGIITTVAGTGVRGFSGDGGLATAAQLGFPLGVGLDAEGNLFIVDSENRRIRKVGTNGIITTICGDGTGASAATDVAGDGGPAILAKLGVERPGFNLDPNGLRVDPQGNVLFADAGLHRVRRISRDGLIVSLAGSGNIPTSPTASNGDGGAALQARIPGPADVDFGSDGSIYTINESTFPIRRVAPPLPGFTGDELAIPSENGAELYRFDASGRHLSTLNTFTGAVIITFGYDANGRLVKITDVGDNTTTIQRNAAGAPTALIGPFGHRTTLATGADGFLTAVTDPLGAAHTFTYATGGLLLSETDPRGSTHTFDYDANGLLTQGDHAGPAKVDLDRVELPEGFYVGTTSALGATGRYQVEDLANGDILRTNTNSTGVVDTLRHAANGVDTAVSPNGAVEKTTLGPDPRFGMMAAIAQRQTTDLPSGASLTLDTVRTATLSNPANPLSLTGWTESLKVSGDEFITTYGGMTRTFTNTSAAGRASTTKVDAFGRVLESKYGNLLPQTLAYDTRSHLTSATTGTGANARAFRFTYNEKGEVARAIDPLNQTTSFTYDVAGRVARRIHPDGGTEILEHDAGGNIASIAPPGKPAHLFTYSALGNIAAYTAPDAGGGAETTTFTYDANERLTQIVRPGAQTIAYTRNLSGLIAARTMAGGTATYAYHPASTLLASITMPDSTAVAFTYDGPLHVGESWSGPITGSVTHTLDDHLRTATQTVNGANSVTFTYDADSLVTAAGAITLTRDPQRGVIIASSLASVTDARIFDAFGGLASYSASSGATPLFSAQYTRNKLGRISQAIETVSGAAADTYTYAYDSRGRLLQVKKNNVGLSTYTYDTNGNRLTANAVAATYDARDRLTQRGTTTYAYTPGGHLLSATTGGQTTAYDHDALGNLLSVTPPTGPQISYVIDGRNRRVGRKVGGALERGFLYHDGARVIAELDASSALVTRFVYADRSDLPAYCVKAGVTYRIIADQNGSVRLVVNAATGAIAQRLDYDAFGSVLADTNPGFQPFGFAGGLYDPATGLVHFGARDYEPTTARWTTTDPVLFDNYETNLYAYCRNDPVNFIDPEGTDTVSIGVYNALGPIPGHVTTSVNGSPFEGFYPDDGGKVVYEGNKLKRNPDYRVRFKITPEQARRIRKFIDDAKKKGKTYDLFTSNCAQFVREALQDAGVLPNGGAEGFTPGDVVIELLLHGGSVGL